MQVTVDELREYYASLSDEMLEDVDPSDLTEIARGCYEREIEKRGLTEEAAPVALPEEAGEESFDVEPDWLDHAACACSYTAVPGSEYASDASRARDVLLAAGVPCHLSIVEPDAANEGSSSFDEYRVLVPESLNLKATSLLDKEIFNAELEDNLRTHFAALSDEDLRALKPEVTCAGLLDRVQRLTRVYNDEVARRRAR